MNSANDQRQSVAFRVDASVNIGTGHVMRCLALANQLREKGVISHFICRAHQGHMAERIKQEGHAVKLMPVNQEILTGVKGQSDYAAWLGAEWLKDAEDTAEIARELSAAWVVADHYAIDARWESKIKAAVGARIMAIDGLADRKHDCDLLLDQACSSNGARRWEGLVPDSCEVFAGPQYVLLRPEFLLARRSLRERDGKIRRIFIAFGGVDTPNATLAAMEAIAELNRPDIVVDVVIGAANPHRAQLQAKCQELSSASLHVQASNMAELMMKADLAISAGGTTLLEQCYLGLPSIVVSIADNQVASSRALQNLGAIFYIGNFESATKRLIGQALLQLINDEATVKKMQLMAEKLMAEPQIKVADALLRNL